ncbi:MAG: type II toxin-antitoxin system RelE/ParE family toxin [Elusimicrobia bacterium]|nr:type II toxin-antitoxin system RelE/ParE family toxin [Elusimicrobiota bacterium]
MYKIIYYSTKRGDVPVKEFILSLNEKPARKVAAFIEILSREGPNLHPPYADHVRGVIRELRIQFARNSVRIMYFFIHKDPIVLLHGFLKKDMALKENDIRLKKDQKIGLFETEVKEDE